MVTLSLDWFIFILFSFVKYTSSSLESGPFNSFTCLSVSFKNSDFVTLVIFGVIGDVCMLDTFTFLMRIDTESDVGEKVKSSVESVLECFLHFLVPFLRCACSAFHVKVRTSSTLTC